MKVYLASWFASLFEIRKRAEELRAEGIEVTSRWLEENTHPYSQISDLTEEFLRETSGVDINDILQASVVVLNVPSDNDLKDPSMTTSGWARGGRHFESGLQYATMLFFKYLPSWIKERGTRRLIVVGHRENVFHYLNDLKKNGLADSFELPEILYFDTWELTKAYLVEISKNERQPVARAR